MEEDKSKNKIHVIRSDFDEEITFYDEKGEPVYGIDIWCYCKFFAEHIQLMYGDNNFDGLSLYEYADIVENNQRDYLVRLIEFNKDGNVYDFQMEMQEKHNVHINAWVLCNLCLFIDKIVHRKLVVLLKPTIADTIGEIHDLESVTFTNKDGSSVTTKNKTILEQVKGALKHDGEDGYEVDRIVDRQEVFKAEMKMCGYFLKWFGLSAEVVTESRLRQFRMKFDQVSVGSISVLPINGKDVKVQWEFVKYKDWKDGKINPLKKEIEPLKIGEPIYFPPDLGGKDLLKR